MLKKLLAKFLYIILLTFNGCVGIIFSILSYDVVGNQWHINENLFYVLVVSAVSLITVLTIVFVDFKYNLVCKISFVVSVVFTAVAFALYYIKASGFLNKFSDVQSFREYVNSFGAYSFLPFILLQFLQVVALPIPAFITVAAGVLLYGPFLNTIYSSIGIIIGSLVAFSIGRKLGYKVVTWIVGEKNLIKTLDFIKGKDKVVFTLMFLFPFFPDDLLCFVAGLTSMDYRFFTIMTIIVRLITILISSYMINNNLIPFHTWWGIVLWAIIFFIVIVIVLKLIKSKSLENKK